MAEFMVDPAELIRLADWDETLGKVLEGVASILEQGVGAAARAAGSAELASAITQFCQQWGEEFRRESEGALVNGANLRTAAQMYQGAEDRASEI